MRLVHSLWTKPMIYNRWFLENQLEPSVWLYTLSYLYARRVADQVILYTDDLGSEYLKCIGYDEVHLSLNSLADVHQKWWCMGKMVAIEEEPLRSIHFDGDVFLKSTEIRNTFNLEGYDVITQMIEQGHLFHVGYTPQLEWFDRALANMPVTGYRVGQKAFNCGVLGFNNESLKRQYLSDIKKMVTAASADEGIMFQMDGKYEPNIIIEQYMLAGLCEATGARTKFVLDPFEIEKAASLNKIADREGFVHAWGKSKYSDRIQKTVKDIIWRLDPDLYHTTYEHCLQLGKATCNK